MDLTRRDFTIATVSSLSALPNGIKRQIDSTDNDKGYSGVAFLFGTEKPPAEFFEDKGVGSYLFQHEDGPLEYTSPPYDGWDVLRDANLSYVTSSDDLPAPTNGTHTLGNRVYFFNGFVTSPYGLDISNSPTFIGRHGSQDGFIHTGGNTAITGTNGGFFARDMYFHAPGGTMFDLTATNTIEMLVESCAFSDAAGIAPISSLGTITGYRVPTFKGCNFEDIAGGLRFEGDPDKIFIWGSPLRNVTTAGVTIFTLSGSATAQIVDFADNYVKDVQSDTEVWRVETGGSPSEVFQYRGTVHDTSVTTSNILTGEADAQAIPYWVSDSFPLRESNVIGELSLDAETTTTINAVDTWYQVAGVTTLGNETERMSQPTAGVLQYDGSKRSNLHVTISTSFTGANGSVYRIALGKNGTVEPASTMRITAGGQNSPVSLATSAIEDLAPGDTISLLVQNLSDTNDVTFQAYTINSLGI